MVAECSFALQDIWPKARSDSASPFFQTSLLRCRDPNHPASNKRPRLKSPFNRAKKSEAFQENELDKMLEKLEDVAGPLLMYPKGMGSTRRSRNRSSRSRSLSRW